MSLVESLVVFVVSLLIGALGIYVGANLIVDVEDYTYAIITALLGAIVWGVVGFFLGWIPLLGPLLVFIAYLTVINARYRSYFQQCSAVTRLNWVYWWVVGPHPSLPSAFDSGRATAGATRADPPPAVAPACSGL